MSTILKALKKLEQEKESLRTPGPMPVYSGSNSPAGRVSEWLHSSWLKKSMVALAILFLSLTALYYYLQSRTVDTPARADRSTPAKKTAPDELAARKKPFNPDISRGAEGKPDPAAVGSPDQTGPVAISRQRPLPLPAPAAKAPGPAPETQPPAGPPIAAGQEPGVEPEPLSAANPPQGAPARELTGSSSDQAASSSSSDLRKVIPPGKQGTATDMRTDTQPGPSQTKRTPSDAYRNTQPLTDGRLKVHAIAWSPTPEECMAVVNNRVVYEGDNVDGFVVVAIRQEDVVVREKGKGMWRVVFGRP